MREPIQGISRLPGQLELAQCEEKPATMLQRRANAPLQAAKPQRACDHGLFSDEAAQLDLVEMLQDPVED